MRILSLCLLLHNFCFEAEVADHRVKLRYQVELSARFIDFHGLELLLRLIQFILLDGLACDINARFLRAGYLDFIITLLVFVSLLLVGLEINWVSDDRLNIGFANGVFEDHK